MSTPTYKGRFPRGTRIQTLLFDRHRFTPGGARTWAREAGFRAPASDVTAERVRVRQADPRRFVPGTFRTITIAPGVQAVIAVPRTTARSSPKPKSKPGPMSKIESQAKSVGRQVVDGAKRWWKGVRPKSTKKKRR
jgi:hypothetical protein